jgi:uncharacterized membrane protein YgdD (TMEM256/DUF423 family)
VKPNWIAIGSISGALAVILGAAAAHALRGKVSEGDLEGWKTAVLYQALHALALVLFGLFVDGRRRDGHSASSLPGWGFLLGTVLFSGALYAHALTDSGAVLHAAPWGGGCFIAGWIAFAVCALRKPERA